MTDPLRPVLDAARALIDATPTLADFTAPLGQMARADLPHTPIPALPLISALPVEGAGPEAALHRAVVKAQDHIDWRRTYSADEVGEDFRNRYGYCELWGPLGHYRHVSSRGFVGFWDKGLLYDWHYHRPEEIYYVLAGAALFRTKGDVDAKLRQGGHRIHASMQGHMLETRTAPLLVFALWRGEGLDGFGVMDKTS